MAEGRLPSNLSILITTSSLTVLQVLHNPVRQSGQCAINSICKSKKEIERKGIRIQWQWVPIAAQFSVRDKAKKEAHKALKRDIGSPGQKWGARSSVQWFVHGSSRLIIFLSCTHHTAGYMRLTRDQSANSVLWKPGFVMHPV